MSKMIQIRNVPDSLHRELKRRAKLHGKTLTDYIQEILEREVARKDRREVIARILAREPVDLGGMTAADLVREGRREAGRE
jgi:plasmid stability protein